MPPCRQLLPVLLVALLALPAPALEWKADTLTVGTAPFQKTIDVVFEFTNRGPAPVTLLDLQTNCDCLDATADAKVYAPGARGTIRARFTTGERAGLIERLITVVTDETPTPIRLRVRIEVPETATLTPRHVGWNLHGPADTQVVEIVPAAGLEIYFSGAAATTEAFTASLETVEPGRRYRLRLAPRDTAVAASAAIRVTGREKSGHDVIVSAYASVQ